MLWADFLQNVTNHIKTFTQEEKHESPDLE